MKPELLNEAKALAEHPYRYCLTEVTDTILSLVAEIERLSLPENRGIGDGDIVAVIKERDKFRIVTIAVLEWWEEHKYDSYATEDDEYNVYDRPPLFVEKALAASAPTIPGDTQC